MPPARCTWWRRAIGLPPPARPPLRDSSAWRRPPPPNPCCWWCMAAPAASCLPSWWPWPRSWSAAVVRRCACRPFRLRRRRRRPSCCSRVKSSAWCRYCCCPAAMCATICRRLCAIGRLLAACSTGPSWGPGPAGRPPSLRSWPDWLRRMPGPYCCITPWRALWQRGISPACVATPYSADHLAQLKLTLAAPALALALAANRLTDQLAEQVGPPLLQRPGLRQLLLAELEALP
jgi:hypothetical protein